MGYLQILQLTALFVLTLTHHVSGCSMTDDVCEFWLEIEHKLAMRQKMTPVFPAQGKIYKYDVTNISAAQPLPIDNIVTVDGWEGPRLVIAVNGTVPGPAIEVYEGQTVIIHVKNSLESGGTSIHWHGLHQRDTPWMDGVAFVTQCPIHPGTSFTYKFEAYPKGTFWYHSHLGPQRSMGLHGAFIIRERKPLEMPEKLLLIGDWNHDWSSDLSLSLTMPGIYVNRTKLPDTESLDGAQFSTFNFHSGLINGKGRFYDENGNHNEAPLEVFTVQKGTTYRFRVISVCTAYPFRISIDDHNLTIIAADGFDIEEVTVESFIVHPAERFDVLVHANRDVKNYWIRAKTLEVNRNHTAEAILRYDSAPMEEPTTKQKQCTAGDECLVLNCPFMYYPADSYTKCLHIAQLRSKLKNDPSPPYIPGKFKEHFFNFGFPMTATGMPAAINGHTLKLPPVSALTQPQEISTRCSDADCRPSKVCQCTYSLDITHGDTVQLVFINMGMGKGWSHPIHMHGHSFYILKTGFGSYNETTGKLLGDNKDINCRGMSCDDATWADSSWKEGNVPGLELKNPPRKDTVIVPTSGYVVVRIKADNPGLWLMHCHIEMHNVHGMALVINESFPNQIPPPAGFPTCRNYEVPKEPDSSETDDENTYPTQKTTYPTQKTNGEVVIPDTIEKDVFWLVVGILIGVIALQFIIVACVCLDKRRKGSQYLTSNMAEIYDKKTCVK